MNKFYSAIHKWLALPFGLIMAIVCITGAILALESTVTSHSEKQFRIESNGREAMSLSELLPMVEATLPDSVNITGVAVSSDANAPYQVTLSKPRRAAIYVNQYSGEVMGKSGRSKFFITVMKLHRWLLDSVKGDGSMSWGKLLVGISTLLFALVLVSGLLMIISRRMPLRRLLTIHFRDGMGRFLHDLHIAGGLYATVFLLIMALTGLTWSFGWYNKAVYALFGTEAPAPRGGNEKGRPHDGKGDWHQGGGNPFFRTKQYANWQIVLEDLQHDNPDSPLITVKRGEASVKVKSGNGFAADQYFFDKRSGEITDVVLYEDADKATKIRGWIMALHTGSWGGMFSRIIWIIAALLGFSLPLTGYYIWFKHLKQKNKSHSSVAKFC